MKYASYLRLMLCGMGLCAFGTLSIAQTYLPFLNRSQWFVEETGNTGQQFDWYHMGQDSIINGESYRKVIAAGLPTSIFVREDVPAEKVWITSAAGNWTERLLYDFSVQLGDTVPLEFAPGGAASYVVTVQDSVNTAMGFMRRIALDRVGAGTPAQVRWAVGVGEDAHPFYLDYTGVSNPVYHLICNYHNRLKVFDDGFATCLPPPVVSAEEAADPAAGPQVYPNPAQDQVTISFPGAKQAWNISVVNLLGVEQLKMVRQPGTQTQVDVSAWPAGIYWVRIRTQGGTVWETKLVRISS